MLLPYIIYHRRSTRSAWSGHLLGTIQAFSNSMVFQDQYYGSRVKNMPRAPRATLIRPCVEGCGMGPKTFVRITKAPKGEDESRITYQGLARREELFESNCDWR